MSSLGQTYFCNSTLKYSDFNFMTHYQLSILLQREGRFRDAK